MGQAGTKISMARLAMKTFDRNFTRRSWSKSSWAKRKDTKPHPILEKTGKLRQSLASKVQIRYVDIGTATEYAGYHNDGNPNTNLPQRQFIGFDLELERRMAMLVGKLMIYVFSNSKKYIVR